MRQNFEEFPSPEEKPSTPSIKEGDSGLSPEEEKELEALKESASGILKSFKLNPANLEKEGKKGDNNLVIVMESGPAGLDPLVKMAFLESAREDFGENVKLELIPDLETSGADLGEQAGKGILSAENILLVGIRSMTHSKETGKVLPEEFKTKKSEPQREIKEKVEERRKKILEKWRKKHPKAAIISMPDAHKQFFSHECYRVDKREADVKVMKLKELFEKTTKAHITSPKGTDIWVTLEPEKYKTFAEPSSIGPGEASNMPSGETAIFTRKVDGKFVIDGFCADNPLETDENGEVKNPIIIGFEDGKATIQGGTKEADKLIEMCELAKKRSIEAGKEQNPYESAEFAVGVLGKPDENGKTPFTLENGTIDEKLSLHLAIGESKDLGGDNESPIHIDFGGQNITLELFDAEKKGTIIMSNGKLMLDNEGSLIQEKEQSF